MAAVAERIRTLGEFFSRAWNGPAGMQKERDVPGLIARWLFRIGVIWAGILLPVTAVFSLVALAASIGSVFYGPLFQSTDRSWMIGPYLLCGYGVWIGWGWRSRGVKRVTLRTLFWAASAAFNLIIPVFAWRNAHEVWVMFMPNVLWPILASIASLVALFLEFRSARGQENS